VTFSAVLIVASLAGLLLFPQGFLKSLTYAGIASVMLAAILSITVLPAVLSILGPNVDALGVRTLLRVPFLRNWKPMRVYLTWLANKLQKTQTREQVERGFWGKLVNVVMKRPILFAAPIVIIMILLIIPLGKLSLGGFSEKYLPPTNSVRQAQEDFDRTFPGFRTEQMTLVIQNATPAQIGQITHEAGAIPGFTGSWTPRNATDEGTKDPNVTVIQNGLQVRNDAPKKIAELRAIEPPKGVTIWVGGTPALEQDSIHSLLDKGPLMLLILISTTTLLMFLAFGSLVLPIKAAVMSALTLGSTMGILTWIFVDGHFSKWLNFTATPLTAPVIGLIIAVIYGLSTDYEVFLVSRMVEARERGMSTAEAIRIGTATTGRIITAAALVLIVVAGAFAFSDLVMMKYLAFGLIAALLLDATVIRMFLVPAVMKMLGDDCWWAPRWMKRIQERIGLGELELPDERKRPTFREPEEALVGAGAPVRPRPPHDPGHPENGTRPGGPSGPGRPPAPPRALPPSTAGTTRIPTAPGPQTEAPTTRFSAPKDATPSAGAVGGSNATAPTQRTPRVDPNRPSAPAAPAAPATSRSARRAEAQRGSTPNREIESWLGELRGGNGGSAQPSADPTRAMPEQRPAQRRGQPQSQTGNEPTTAIPTQRQRDPEATEKIDTHKADEEPKRRGGGVSAADLLRREGRL
jgi:RND superfamily putative drug exporter